MTESTVCWISKNLKNTLNQTETEYNSRNINRIRVVVVSKNSICTTHIRGAVHTLASTMNMLPGMRLRKQYIQAFQFRARFIFLHTSILCISSQLDGVERLLENTFNVFQCDAFQCYLSEWNICTIEFIFDKDKMKRFVAGFFFSSCFIRFI